MNNKYESFYNALRNFGLCFCIFEEMTRDFFVKGKLFCADVFCGLEQKPSIVREKGVAKAFFSWDIGLLESCLA